MARKNGTHCNPRWEACLKRVCSPLYTMLCCTSAAPILLLKVQNRDRVLCRDDAGRRMRLDQCTYNVVKTGALAQASFGASCCSTVTHSTVHTVHHCNLTPLMKTLRTPHPLRPPKLTFDGVAKPSASCAIYIHSSWRLACRPFRLQFPRSISIRSHGRHCGS